MAKRFTDTNKYKKDFHRSLPGPYKLLWDYLYHDCDHAGIWHCDFEIAQIYIGKDMAVDYETALSLFNSDEERIVVLKGGQKWFIRPFIDFQYGDLNPAVKLHASVIALLRNEGIEPFANCLQTVKDKNKDKDKDKDKDVADQKFVLPEWIDLAAWQAFEEMRKKIRKPMTDRARVLVVNELERFRASGNDPTEVLEQSVRKSWQDVYELKEKSHVRPGAKSFKDQERDAHADAKRKAAELVGLRPRSSGPTGTPDSPDHHGPGDKGILVGEIVPSPPVETAQTVRLHGKT